MGKLADQQATAVKGFFVDISIVVTPRERFTSVIDSLQSLFSTIEADVPVILVEGCSPQYIRDQIAEIKKSRDFTWIALDRFITPQEARNIGFEQCDNRYVVFSDNDIHYETGWLEAMYNNAETHDSDVIGPVVCIGPPAAKKIHHAGGRLSIRLLGNSQPFVDERHQLMNQPLSMLQRAEHDTYNEIVEFHCLMVRSDYLVKIGLFTEALITREQIDFGLRNQFHEGKVTFEPKAVVTYMATGDFIEEDLRYLSFRWSDKLAQSSLDYFVETWGIQTNKSLVLNSWIRPHRARAYRSCFKAEYKEMGDEKFKAEFMKPMEDKFCKEAFASRKSAPAAIVPPGPTKTEAQAFFQQYAKKSDLQINGAPAVQKEIDLVFAGIATGVSGRDTFRAAIDSILPQVDRLFVYQDRFKTPYRFKHPKIISRTSQQVGDFGASGKFLGLIGYSPGPYYFSLDDDIIYPDDYVAQYIDAIRSRRGWAIFGAQGSLIKRQNFSSYLEDRDVLKHSSALTAHTQVDVLNTGTVAFSTRLLLFDARKWQNTNMVDLSFAKQCKSRRIELLSIKRERDWIQCPEKKQSGSTYTNQSQDDSVLTKMATDLIAR